MSQHVQLQTEIAHQWRLFAQRTAEWCHTVGANTVLDGHPRDPQMVRVTAETDPACEPYEWSVRAADADLYLSLPQGVGVAASARTRMKKAALSEPPTAA